MLFRSGSIQDPNSRLRLLHREISEKGPVTRKGFYKIIGKGLDENGNVRQGWGSSFFEAVGRSGFIRKVRVGNKVYYVPGPKWNQLDKLVKIFDKIGGPLEWDEVDEFVSFFTRDTVHYRWDE